MDKYLKQLLETYAKVILPSFGAIVVENEETGNLMFNEYLSYNDGKLDGLIVKESNMELQEAQNMIAKYVRDIQVELDKGGSYDIFELGRFYKNADGEIEFEGNLKDGPKSQSKKDAPKVATKKDSESDSKKEETSKSKEGKKESKPESEKEEKIDPKAKEEVKKNTKSETKSTEKENKLKAKKVDVDSKKDKSKQDIKKKTKPVKKEKAQKTPKKKKDKTSKDGKKKKRFGTYFWVAIIILALASAGSIYVGLNYEEVKSYMGWDKFDNKENVDTKESKDISDEANNKEAVDFDADENPVSDTTEASNVEFDEDGNEIKEEQENNSETETKPTPSPEPKQAQTSSTGSHHLIAGSFSNLSNAEGLVKELKSKGLNAQIIGEFGGLHFVSAASYNSSKEARADIDRIRQNAPGSWIFKYNNK